MDFSLRCRKQIDTQQRADQQRENNAGAEMKAKPALPALIDAMNAIRTVAAAGEQRIATGPAAQAIDGQLGRAQSWNNPDSQRSIASVEAIDAIQAVRIAQQRHATHTSG